MSDSSASEPQWRVPQQARSRERFSRILDAAAALFAEVGYDAVTTDAIAARAQTSVGGLYRFFPDKLGVFHALVERYLTQLRQLFATLHSDGAIHLSLEDYIGQVIDGFDRFVSQNPAFGAVFIQSRLVSTRVRAMDLAFNQEIAQQLAAFLSKRYPELPAEQLDLVAIVSVEVASSLELLSLRRDRAFQEWVLAETKKLLVAYLRLSLEDKQRN